MEKFHLQSEQNPPSLCQHSISKCQNKFRTGLFSQTREFAVFGAMSSKKGSMNGTLASYFPTISKSNISAKRNSSSDSGGTPTTKKKPTAESLSPEQHSKMEHNKQEAAAKLWASRLKAGTIGCSWMKILYDEFKKPYFEEVIPYSVYNIY